MHHLLVFIRKAGRQGNAEAFAPGDEDVEEVLGKDYVVHVEGTVEERGYFLGFETGDATPDTRDKEGCLVPLISQIKEAVYVGLYGIDRKSVV